MPAPWVGLTWTRDEDVEAYKAKKIAELKGWFIYAGILALASVALLAIHLVQKDSSKEDLPKFPFVLAVSAFGVGWVERQRMKRTTFVKRKKTLTVNHLSDETRTNIGVAVGSPRKMRWKDLSRVEVVASAIGVQFTGLTSNETMFLPLDMFPNDEVRDEFLKFARGTLYRKGLSPKPEFIDRTVDPSLDTIHQ